MSDALVLAIDNGTSSTKCLVVDDRGQVVGRGQAPVPLATPEPGWVEQDANEIWASVRRAAAEALDQATAKRVASVGLSTQRESCVIWDRRSGEALTPVLSWQDQRTESVCATLRASGHGGVIRRKSGLPLDPMFSAAKARWLLDRLPSGQARARAEEICIGTIDSFILSRFGGEAVIEAGNASRTQLFNVVEGRWDEELLSIFDVPLAAMPSVVASTGPFPAAKGLAPLPDGVAVGAVMADSHSALFAHGAFAPGPVKATHGTGSSVMGLVDRKAVSDGDAGAPGVCLTLAWQIEAPMLAFEGNIRSAGSTLIWAAELLGVDTQELARLAASAADSRGVYLVPAFGGLGAPWWDASAVGIVSGVTFGVTRAPLARAALEFDRPPDRRRSGRGARERRSGRTPAGRRRSDAQRPAHAVRGRHGRGPGRTHRCRRALRDGRRVSRRRERRSLHLRRSPPSRPRRNGVQAFARFPGSAPRARGLGARRRAVPRSGDSLNSRG